MHLPVFTYSVRVTRQNFERNHFKNKSVHDESIEGNFLIEHFDFMLIRKRLYKKNQIISPFNLLK